MIKKMSKETSKNSTVCVDGQKIRGTGLFSFVIFTHEYLLFKFFRKLNINRFLLFVIIKISLGGVVLFGYNSIMAAQPGSEADPLVSVSYLEQRLAAHTIGSGITDELLEFIVQDITRSVLQTLGETDQLRPLQGYMYVPVNVQGGYSLIGGYGTEIILRTGSAVSFTDVDDGIVNVTTGRELFNGDEVQANNVIIVPREDGRGVVVTSNTAWFLVRGSYTIR